MKKILSLPAVIIIAVLCVGCQATPEKPVVIQKDMEQMIEKAVTKDDTQMGMTLAESLNAPAAYTTSFNGYNGELTVDADAVVTIPNASGISVLRVSKHNFTQEEADRMMEVFLQGSTLYEIGLTPTKDDIEQKLITYYGMRDGSIPINMDGENPKDEDKLKQAIKHWEELLADAPETKARIPANLTMHSPETLINPNAKVIEGMATVNDKAAYLYVNNGFFDENDIEAVFINAMSEYKMSYDCCPYSVFFDEKQLPDTFAITEESAKATAEDILKQLGITHMSCVDTRPAVMLDEMTSGDADAGRMDAASAQLEKGKWAYSLTYQRDIYGIPVTLTSDEGTSLEGEADVSVPWAYEKLQMIIDETGVVYFCHQSPYTVQGTVTKDAALKPFSDIASVFEKMFPITYGYLDEEGTDYKMEVNISEVRLGLMRITEQNRRDTGLLIPVWDFFGDVLIIPYQGDSYPFSFSRTSLMTINAIDGSIIDRHLGY